MRRKLTAAFTISAIFCFYAIPSSAQVDPRRIIEQFEGGNPIGTPVVRALLRLNDDDPEVVFLRPAGNFRNELAISPSFSAPITDGAYWRLYVSIPTNVEPIIVKIPLLEPQVQKVVKSCS